MNDKIKSIIPDSLDTNPNYRPDLFLREFNSNLNAIERILNGQRKKWGTEVKQQILNLEFGKSDIKIIVGQWKETQRWSKSAILSILVDLLVDSKLAFKLEINKEH